MNLKIYPEVLMSEFNRRIVFLFALILFVGFFTNGAVAKSKKEPEKAPSQIAANLKDPDGLKALKYRSIGPAWGGRVDRAAGVPGDPMFTILRPLPAVFGNPRMAD